MSLREEISFFQHEEEFDRVRPLEHQVKKVDEKIDGTVDRLYGLTDEEVKVIEGK